MIKNLSIVLMATLPFFGCSEENKKQRNMDDLISLELGDGGSGDGGTNFVDHIKPIVEKHCLQCHETPASWNWANYDVAVAGKAKIYDRVVVKKDMPKGGSITQGEIDLIAEWTLMPEPPYSNDPGSAPAGGGGGNNALLEEILATVKAGNSDPGVSEKLQSVLSSLGENTKTTPGFEEDILPLVKNHCSICHGPGLANENDWSDYAVAKKFSASILDRISRGASESGIMPPKGRDTLLPFEKNQVKKWVEGGALEKRKVEIGSASLLELVTALKDQSDNTAAGIADLREALSVFAGNSDKIDALDIKLDKVLGAFGASKGTPVFEETIKPIFEKSRCMDCHSQWNDYATVAASGITNASGREGRGIIPMVESGAMPQGDRPKVSADDLAVLKQWYQDGAPEFVVSEGESPEPINIGALLTEAAETDAEQMELLARILLIMGDRSQNTALHEKLDALMFNAGIEVVKHFDRDVAGILRTSCALSGCHNRTNDKGNRYLTGAYLGSPAPNPDSLGYDSAAAAVLYDKDGSFVGFRPRYLKKLIAGELVEVSGEEATIKLEERQRISLQAGEEVVYQPSNTSLGSVEILTVSSTGSHIFKNGYDAIYEIDPINHQYEKATEVNHMSYNDYTRLNAKNFEIIRQWVVNGGKR